MTDQGTANDGNTEDTLDIAIVGGGIAGLYCSYKLNTQSRLRVALFEAALEAGGRIKTGHFDLPIQPEARNLATAARFTRDHFYPEFGPMRIEPEHQQLLRGLLNELDIKETASSETEPRLVTFPAYASPLAELAPEYLLTGEENDQVSPLDLMKLGFLRILGRLHVRKLSGPTKDQRNDLDLCLDGVLKKLSIASATHQSDWKPLLQEWIDSLDEADYQNIRDYAEIDSIPIRQMGFWNLLSDVLSYNAVMKLRDLGTFYHLIAENPNAAEWIIFWLRALKTTDKLQGIALGMDHITKRLTEKVKQNGIELNYNHKLLSLEPDGSKIKLRFANNQSRVARHVILAIPKRPLQKVALANNAFGEDIRKAIDGVFEFPLLKVFVVVKKRWWEEDQRANVGATRMPTRELHYWKSQVPGSTRGMVMIYTDRPGTAYWANYVGATGYQDRPEISTQDYGTDKPFRDRQNRRLKSKFIQQMRELGVDKVHESDIECFGIMDWGREPYGGAAHAWRPERDPTQLLKQLSEAHFRRSDA